MDRRATDAAKIAEERIAKAKDDHERKVLRERAAKEAADFKVEARALRL